MEQMREALLAQRVGKAIAKQRLAVGLTQEEVAESLGIGNEAVSRMERGINIPTITRLIEIAEMLNCEVADLIQEASDRVMDQAQTISKLLEQMDAQDRAATVEILTLLTARLSAKKQAS